MARYHWLTMFLPFSAGLEEYEAQAAELLQGHREGNKQALRLIHENHPRFLDKEVVWLPLRISSQDVQAAPFDLDDARLALARSYNFQNWEALGSFAVAMQDKESPAYRFEAAAEAVITGDEARLRELLNQDPELVHARSTRVTHFDPPMHQATLVHYLGANGVEGYRQKTPPNAVEIAEILLQAGADPNALADMYGSKCAVMGMLVSSSPPFQAGLQSALVEKLVEHGADVNPRGAGKWTSPVQTALVFGFKDTALTLVRLGARVEGLITAAGLGNVDEAATALADADPEDRHKALALAAQAGNTEVVRLLLDAGEDPNRFNPDGFHSHSTPLHQAALAGHNDTVRLLVERGACLDRKDKLWQSTPLGWAEYSGKQDIAELLKSFGG